MAPRLAIRIRLALLKYRQRRGEAGTRGAGCSRGGVARLNKIQRERLQPQVGASIIWCYAPHT